MCVSVNSVRWKMKRKDQNQKLLSLIIVLCLNLLSLHVINAAVVPICNKADQDSLISFQAQIISSKSPLNWTTSSSSSNNNCCQWEGVTCNNNNNDIEHGRVTRLSLPNRGLSGNISPFLKNLTFLTYLNLSGNQFSAHLPIDLFDAFDRLQVLDLSSNHFTGLLQPPQTLNSLPSSIVTVDLSDNRFNGSIDPSFIHRASKLLYFNVSNNSFSGPLPSSICSSAPFVEFLDFSYNNFGGHIFHGFGGCRSLKSLRAGFNALTGWLPYDLYRVRSLKEISLPSNHLSGPVNSSIVQLSDLTILELHSNEFTGEIPKDIGNLTRLEQLLLHTNNFSGPLPPSLMECTNLTTLLMRNNHFDGEISILDFSKLVRVQAIDLGNNSFVGNIPQSLCLCRSLTALRLAYNQLTGEVPPCMASLTTLEHLSLSDNFLSNLAGALQTLQHCDNLAVLFMSRCFHAERLPDDNDMVHLKGFQNLQIFTIGGCQLTGQIPLWIAKLKKVKVLNLSYNLITGPIPAWLGDMPNLFVLNLTQNYLSGNLPREIGNLPALISDNSSTDLSYLALPFLFDSLQYNRLFNLPRGLKVGNNSLSGIIPEEIGRLKLLHILDLGINKFEGSIPDQLSKLVNLERLDLSNNHLTGKIPSSLTSLSFLSSFSVANNDLEGEIPRGPQFDSFPVTSFEGNPKLCGTVLMRTCLNATHVDGTTGEDDDNESSWRNVPFGVGYFVGFLTVSTTLLFYSGSWRCCSGANGNNNIEQIRSV